MIHYIFASDSPVTPALCLAGPNVDSALDRRATHNVPKTSGLERVPRASSVLGSWLLLIDAYRLRNVDDAKH